MVQQLATTTPIARTVIGRQAQAAGTRTVEELPDRPFGSEHVKGRMLPMLRNDLALALRFCAAIPPDKDSQTPLIA